jgi:hypothetical protein
MLSGMLGIAGFLLFAVALGLKPALNLAWGFFFGGILWLLPGAIAYTIGHGLRRLLKVERYAPKLHVALFGLSIVCTVLWGLNKLGSAVDSSPLLIVSAFAYPLYLLLYSAAFIGGLLGAMLTREPVFLAEG